MRIALKKLLLLLAPALLPAQATRASRLPRGDEPMLARVLRMSDTRALDTVLVDSALATGRSHLRAATARAIGQVGGTARAARLRALLTDADTAVAAEAAFALGSLRDTTAIVALGAALGRLPVGIEAAWSLGEIGEPARGELSRALESGSLSPRAAEFVLLAAAKLRPVPIAAVIRHLGHADAGVVRAAAYAIARPGVAAGARALLPLASSPDAETRMHVASASGRRASGDSLMDQVLPVLARLAADRDARVRVNAARSLASHGPVARDAVRALLRDMDANVRIASAQSLATVADTAATWWPDAWAADTGFTYRRSILESAARRGRELPALYEWLGRSDWRVRSAAVGAIQQLPAMERRRALAERALRDTSGPVRAAAFSIFLADSTRPDRDSLITRALEDRSMAVRGAGLGALRTSRRPSVAAATALETYRRAHDDKENDVRLQALGLIRLAWRADSAGFDGELVSALRALPRPPDPLERAVSPGVTPLSAWGPVAGDPRPLIWYDSLVRAFVRPAMAGRPAIAELRTGRGTITLELFGADAPITVENFVRLARSGYYSGTRFHRVVPNFVAQDGDPTGTGSGGPGYAIRDELNRRRYTRGALGMALSGPDTGGSQYFICHSAQPHLDGHYTVFGRLVAGALSLDRIVQGDRIVAVRIR